jgi:hypothetical protein
LVTVVDIQLRVGGFAEAHPVAFALLVAFAVVGGEGGAAEILCEAVLEVGVKVDAARLGLGAFGQANTAHGEGTDKVLVPELDEVAWLVAEKLVTGDTHLVGVLGAEEAA